MARLDPEWLLAIDPGVHMSGWAVFRGQSLVQAGLARARKTLDPGDKTQTQASALLAVRAMVTPSDFFATVVVEHPVVYPGTSSVADPNDIVALAYAAGGLAHALAGKDARVVTPTPRQWKGTVPKAIHHQRLRSAHLKAVPVVRAACAPSLQHHVWDAVGLGFWQLARTRT